jgi:hypothetical protein
MKTRDPSPIKILTTTFPPWLSDYVEDAQRHGQDPRAQLLEIRNQWLGTACALLSSARHILGFAFHGDTDDPHFDIAVSRQDGSGGRIGRAGLRIAGPWCVGTDRQVRAGAKISTRKRAQLTRSVRNFRWRYGDHAVPTDIALARALDDIARGIIGPELDRWMTAYARGVPALEAAHQAAALAALDAAREQITVSGQRSPPGRSAPEPTTQIAHNPEPELPNL